MGNKHRKITGLLGMTVLLPLAVLALGAWEGERGEADWAGFDAERLRLVRAVDQLEARQPPDGRLDFSMQFRRDGQTFAGPLAVTQAREAREEIELLCKVMALRRLLPAAVMWASGLGAGLSGLVLIAGAVLGRLGRASREVLVHGFALMQVLLPLILATQVMLSTAAFVAAGVFEAAALLRPSFNTGEVKMLFLAALAVLGSLYAAGAALVGLRNALAAFEPDALVILGRLVSPAEAPGLWRLAAALAERLGALAPDAIVVGLTGGFFVSAGPKVLEPERSALSGQTLYVPLPYLALLRVDELAAIIGHELAHFAGRDAAYSLRFSPIYAGMVRSLDAVAAARGSGFGLLGPPMRLGVFVMDRFHHAVRHWSRRREFAADAASAGLTTPETAVRALLRVEAVHPRIAEILATAAVDVAVAPDDLVGAAFDHACARGLDDPARRLGAEQAHPTDTHPPTRERVGALGLSASPKLLASAVAVPHPQALGRLAAYFAHPGEVCRAATGDFLAVTRRRRAIEEAHIEALAAAVQPGEQVFTTDVRGAARFFLSFGALLLGMAAVLLATGVPGTSLGGSRLVAGGSGVLGAAFCGFGLLYLRRGRQVWLALRPEALAFTGLCRSIDWDDVLDLDMAWFNNRVTMRVLVSPGAPLPERLPGARRIRLDAAQRTVTVAAVLPRRVKPHDFVALIASYRRAAQARRFLAARNEGASRSDHAATPVANDASPAGSASSLRLRPLGGGWKQAAWTVFSSAMFSAMSVAAVVYIAPPLVSDWEVHGAARPIADARVLEGRCNSQVVFQICEVTLAVRTAAGPLSREIHYAFTGAHVGDDAGRVVADPTRLELATTDMALDRLWNRTITLIAGLIVVLMLMVLPLVAVVRNRRGTAPMP